MTPKRILRKVAITSQQQYTIRALHQECKIPVHVIIKQKRKLLKGISKSTIYRHSKIPLDEPATDYRKGNKNTGRPSKLSTRDINIMRREVHRLRKSLGSFSSIDLQKACGLLNKCSNGCFREHMKKHGYGYLVTRKKGLLTDDDKKARQKFARGIIRDHGKGDQQLELWRSGISLYTDIVGFQYKVRYLPNIMYQSIV